MSDPPARPSIAPWKAAAASLVWPGLGHALVGQRGKGALFAVVTVFTCGFCGILHLVTALDAWALARKRRRGEPVGPWETSRIVQFLDTLGHL